MGNPTLLLTTVGRRTGSPRVTALTYGREGADYLVVGSNGGSSKAPDWLANIRSDARCHVRIGRRQHEATATILIPGDTGFDRRWQIVNDVNKGRYNQYQQQTRRPIPIVQLRPDDQEQIPTTK